jgi:WD40 repeat protein
MLVGSDSFYLCDVTTGATMRSFNTRGLVHQFGMSFLGLSADGSRFLSGGYGSLVLWDLNTGNFLRAFPGHMDIVFSAAFSPDGSKILIGNDNSAAFWDVNTGNLTTAFIGHSFFVFSVSISANGDRVLTGSYDLTARVWNSVTGDSIRTFSWNTAEFRISAISPDGSKIISFLDSTALLLDVNTGTVIRKFSGHTETIMSMAFSPDGSRVLTGSIDNTARLWDAETGIPIRTFAGHSYWIRSVAYSPDGSMIATGSDDHTARVWDANSGSLIMTLSGHSGRIYSVAFSPDGSRLVTGSDDKTARLWDIATGKTIRVFSGFAEDIEAVAYSPDGRKIFTGGGNDGTHDVPVLWNICDLVVPDPPVCLSPKNDTINQPTNLYFHWNENSCARKYRFQLSTDSLFTTTLIDDSTLTGVLTAANSLPNKRLLYWHVQAQNAGGKSVWSAIQRFTTIVARPAPVLQVSPVHNDTLGSDSILFVWQKGSPEVTSYKFEVACDSTMTGPVLDTVLTDTLFIAILPAKPNYWWRVKAGNIAGWGDFSNVRRFTDNKAQDVMHRNAAINTYSVTTTKSSIAYSLPKQSKVVLRLVDMRGKIVKTIVNQSQERGIYYMKINKIRLSKGIYILWFKAGNFETKLDYPLYFQ